MDYGPLVDRRIHDLSRDVRLSLVLLITLPIAGIIWMACGFWFLSNNSVWMQIGPLCITTGASGFVFNLFVGARRQMGSLLSMQAIRNKITNESDLQEWMRVLEIILKTG